MVSKEQKSAERQSIRRGCMHSFLGALLTVPLTFAFFYFNQPSEFEGARGYWWLGAFPVAMLVFGAGGAILGRIVFMAKDRP